MAFLCPVRMRRNKKKNNNGYSSEGEEKMPRNVGMGRITGSASIETLVRVGLEKEAGLAPDSKMVVMQDFTPCVDDELEVKRGCIVNVLYQENDWVYVIAENQREGFIPHSYCTPYNGVSLNHKKKIPRDHTSLGVGRDHPDLDHNTTIGTASSGGTETIALAGGVDTFDAKNNSTRHMDQGQQSSTPDVHPFYKDPSGRYIVLYTFIARDENDVNVERGEFVTVLNREDPEWYWVVRSDGQEGFVPSGFVYAADVIQDHLQHMGNYSSLSNGATAPNNIAMAGSSSHQGGYGNSPHHIALGAEDIPGTELVMLYDYKAQAPDDLSVRRGDWIYADLEDQSVDGWLWVYAPKGHKCGFIPKAYARPPAMTSL